MDRLNDKIKKFVKKNYQKYSYRELVVLIKEKLHMDYSYVNLKKYCQTRLAPKEYKFKFKKEHLAYLREHIEECHSYRDMARLLFKKFKFKYSVNTIARHLMKTKFKPRNARYKLAKMLSSDEIQFFKDNVNKYTRNNLVKAFNKKFHRRLSNDQIGGALSLLKIIRHYVKIDEKKIRYLRKLYNDNNSPEEITRKFFEKYNCILTTERRRILARKNGIKRVWHGYRISRYKDFGSEIKRSNGIIYVKVSQVNKKGIRYNTWTPKKRYVYEKAIGKIGKDTIILPIDGNNNNCNLDNLVAIDAHTFGRIVQLKWNKLPKNVMPFGIKYCELMTKYEKGKLNGISKSQKIS